MPERVRRLESALARKGGCPFCGHEGTVEAGDQTVNWWVGHPENCIMIEVAAALSTLEDVNLVLHGRSPG